MAGVHWKDKYKNIRSIEIEPDSRIAAEQELIIFDLVERLYRTNPKDVKVMETVTTTLFGLTDDRAVELIVGLAPDENITSITDYIF